MKPRRRPVALRLEPLESRCLLAYTFTDIADSTAQPFLGAGFENTPTIDSHGRVAFRAGWPFNVGLYVGDGQSVTAVRTAVFPQYLEGTSLNDRGELAVFSYFYQGGDWQIYRTDNPQTQTYIARDPRGQFGIHPSVNDAGTVAFTRLAPGTPAVQTGSGGPLTTVAQQDGYFKDFADAPALNGAGGVAFLADLADGGQGVFVRQGGVVRPVAVTGDTFAGFLSYGAAVGLNARGQVAFTATLTGGGSGVFVGGGGEITTVADTGGPFTGFGAAVSIDDHGRVAFVGLLPGNGSGIYVATRRGIKKVIATGDELFGAPVTGVSLFHQGLNDNGSLAFIAYYANNRSAVVRADRAPKVSEFPGTAFTPAGPRCVSVAPSDLPATPPYVPAPRQSAEGVGNNGKADSGFTGWRTGHKPGAVVTAVRRPAAPDDAFETAL